LDAQEKWLKKLWNCATIGNSIHMLNLN